MNAFEVVLICGTSTWIDSIHPAAILESKLGLVAIALKLCVPMLVFLILSGCTTQVALRPTGLAIFLICLKKSD